MSCLLDDIRSPEDIKDFDLNQLNQLAEEIRECIIDTVSKYGGHLAPSLGVVELSIALHYVFNSPSDRIIWDVGHQAYAHKLLTGRREQFHTLRQQDGISGFPKIAESPHDALDTGHSSTSISAALGMATAISMKHEDERRKVVAVIGDGSMTAGLAFEALNNAGSLKKDLVVILNDNEMSISPNVGALSSFLSRKLTSKFATRMKQDMEAFLKRTEFGKDVWSVLKRSEDSLKSFFTPGMLFEALQFEYIGPIPGHKTDALIETLKNTRNIKGPVLVHVLTRKGKGYKPAEDRPDLFHGLGPFDRETGRPVKPKGPAIPSYTEIFSQTITRIARENKKLCAITAAMPSGTGLKDFQEKFPGRFFDVGIAEQHAVTFAAGLSLEGIKPVVAIYSTFLQRAYDQIIHDVCLTRRPVMFSVDRGGLVGDDGPTHHGVFDLSFLRTAPNMVIMAPKDENELQHMIYTGICHDGPVAVRYPRGRGEGASLDLELTEIPIGRGVLERDGRDMAIIAIGNMVPVALKAAEILAEEGIDAAVMNGRFAKPLDTGMICELAARTGHVITIEENALAGGFGSGVLEVIADAGLSGIRTKRLGLPDKFIEQGTQANLRKVAGIDVDSLVKAAREIRG
jgi:1-deoxy-D-xylulose-5-phosphate synthase